MASRQLYQLNTGSPDTSYYLPVQRADGSIEMQKATVTTILGLIAAGSLAYAKIQNVSATNKLLGRASTGAGPIEEISCTPFGRTLLAAADQADARSIIGLAVGSDVQAYDADLAAIAALASANDRLPYFTGSGTAALATFTAAGRALVDDADTAAQRVTLGLVIGTDVQAFDAELAAIAGLASANDRLPYFTGSGTAALATFTAAGRALVDDADSAAQRVTLGLDKRVIAQWPAYTGTPTQTNGAQQGSRTGGSSSAETFLGVAYDGVADEMWEWDFMVPSWFVAGSGMKLIFYTISDATTGNYVFQAALRTCTNDLDASESHNYVSTGAVATSATAGQPTKTTITLSSSQIDGAVAGDWCRLRLRRDADNTSATDSITANDVIVIGSMMLEEA